MIQGYWGGCKLCSKNVSSSLTPVLLHWVGPSNQLRPLDCEQECCVASSQAFPKAIGDPQRTPLSVEVTGNIPAGGCTASLGSRERTMTAQSSSTPPLPTGNGYITWARTTSLLGWTLRFDGCLWSQHKLPPPPLALYPTQMAPWKRVSSDKLADLGNLVSDAKCYYLVRERSLSP